MLNNSWSNFWQRQALSRHEIMRLNTAFFCQNIQRLFPIEKGTRVLDYGCGPGFLLDYLDLNKVNVTGTDINSEFISFCKAKYQRDRFLEISPDVEVTTELLKKEFGYEKFDYVILLSIAQYLPDSRSLDVLIKMLATHLSARGKIILADVIDDNSSMIKDTRSLLYHTVKEKKFAHFFKFMANIFLSDYRKISKLNKLLHVSQADVRVIALRNGMTCEKVDGLTIHSSRTNYILSK
jgi:2-polyprenyl-3-methyl-5-hydroxy-6-metoxy-1,4-benzoquinol methylase